VWLNCWAGTTDAELGYVPGASLRQARGFRNGVGIVIRRNVGSIAYPQPPGSIFSICPLVVGMENPPNKAQNTMPLGADSETGES
jgi:hypothetical protein